MAKTTATVTVGADTKPFARAMRGLGKSVTGGVTAGVGRAGGMAMSGLGAGLGIGAAFLGLQGLGSIFDKMRAVSPELNAELTRLKVTVGDALFPAAEKLAGVLRDNMPAIEAGLGEFGTMLADAIQFWTEDAFNFDVWKDLGAAIVDGIKSVFIGEEELQRQVPTVEQVQSLEFLKPTDDDGRIFLANVMANLKAQTEAAAQEGASSL